MIDDIDDDKNLFDIIRESDRDSTDWLVCDYDWNTHATDLDVNSMYAHTISFKNIIDTSKV